MWQSNLNQTTAQRAGEENKHISEKKGNAYVKKIQQTRVFKKFEDI